MRAPTDSVNSRDPALSVPKPTPGCDLRSLPIGPREAFLLSRIDGTVSERDLALLTGLDDDATREAIDHLVAIGAITLGASAPPPRRTPPGRVGSIPTPTPISSRPIREVAPDRPVPSPRTALYDESALDEPCDLDRERRRRVLDIFHRLDDLDHYELLGVPPDADKRSIKKAYYSLAPEVHPDRFYGKELGSFKPKMEAIFGRITIAHDTLVRTERRQTYDELLAGLHGERRGAPLSSSPPVPEPAPEPTGMFPSAPPGAPDLPVEPIEAFVPAPPAELASESEWPELSYQATPSSSRNVESDQARRAALARKLGAAARAAISVRPHAVPSPTPPPPAVAPEDHLRALKQMSAAVRAQQRANERRGASMPPPSSASLPPPASSLGFAPTVAVSSSAPPPPSRVASSASSRNTPGPRPPAEAPRAAAAVAPVVAAPIARVAPAAPPPRVEPATPDELVDEADRAAAGGDWSAAARGYREALEAGALADADLYCKAARACLRDGDDLLLALEYAGEATRFAPQWVDARLVLVEALLETGQDASARLELDQARGMAPRDARIADLSRRLG